MDITKFNSTIDEIYELQKSVTCNLRDEIKDSLFNVFALLADELPNLKAFVYKKGKKVKLRFIGDFGTYTISESSDLALIDVHQKKMLLSLASNIRGIFPLISLALESGNQIVLDIHNRSVYSEIEYNNTEF